MDLKALIAKMDQIESKKFLTESKDKGDMDHDGVDEPDPKEYKDNKDAAIKKAMGKKDKEVDESMINFKGAIAQALLREFGLDDLAERVPLPVANPYDPSSPEGKLFPTLSPRDQEWLTRGGQQPAFADDPYIKARMPDKGKPVAAKPAAAPAIDAGATDMSLGQAGAANAADAAAGATDMSLGQAGAANAASTAAVPSPVISQPIPQSKPLDSPTNRQGLDQAKVKRFQELLDKIKVGGSANSTPTPGGSANSTPTPGGSANSTPTPGGTYQIKPGDNLTKIAKANGTTIQAIMAVNPQIKDPNKIQAGAKLNLPGGAQSSGKPELKPSALPGKAVPGASGSMMGDIDPTTGMPANPMPESLSQDDKILALIRGM